MNRYAKYLRSISHSEDFFGGDTKEVFFTHVITYGDGFFYHDHKFYEIIYITQGNIKHIVNGEWLNLKLGDILFLRPNDLHLYIRENEVKCSHRDLIIEKKFFEEMCNWLNADLLKTYYSPTLPFKVSMSSEQIIALEEHIKRINQSNLDDFEKKMTLTKSLVIDLLTKLYTKITTDTFNSSYPQLINRIIETANVNYANPIHTILKTFNYDKSYICRQFKKHVGMTMTDYVNNLRLNYVISQLALTRKNILDISYEAGFHSVSYLNHLFKKKYGVTPSEYRKGITAKTE
ncbi:MAG: AraC family transcriptional regulator [Clostridia bacterium]|nr:AraC family transcriptional regulator [Clostridia bacterium]